MFMWCDVMSGNCRIIIYQMTCAKHDINGHYLALYWLTEAYYKGKKTCPIFKNLLIQIYCLWNLSLCCASPFREAVIVPHMSQGRAIPVIWLASMWLGMFWNCPSFPQTLQIFAFLPSRIRFSLTDIMDFTFSANSVSFVRNESLFSAIAVSW